MRALRRLPVYLLLIVFALPSILSAEPLIERPDVTGEGGAAGGLITRITPGREAVIQTRRPVIAAYFANWGSGIAFSRIRMWVNGQEVNPQIRTAELVSYRPFVPLPIGRIGVQLQVYDLSGLRADVVWAFTIQGDDGTIPGGGTDYQGPIITSVRPAREGVVNTGQPLITATFADRGTGVDPNRTRMWVDGVEVAPQVRNASVVQYQPRQPLPARRIGVEVWVFDRLGNRSDIVWAFSIGGFGGGIPGGGITGGGGIDQQGPFVTSLRPGREEAVGTSSPVIAVTFADRGAGVDPARTRLWVNGQEVAPQIRSATRVQYRPVRPLPVGRIGVQAWIFDHSGNRTDVVWAFTVAQY